MGNIQLFSNFSLNVFESEIVNIVIPTGGGKTILTNILCGLEDFPGLAFFKESPVRQSFKEIFDRGEITPVHEKPLCPPN